MAGTKIGGRKAAETNKQRYGENFYSIQGAKGGAKSRGGGFTWMKENGQTQKIQAAGRRGGRISRRYKQS